MGFFSEDMLPMLGVFEAETSELMTSLDSIASRAERERAFSADDVAELFRCAHTTKGSSAMMGLDSLSRLTHNVEDLFDHMRSNPELAENRVDDILDHLYAFSDFVKDELKRMSDEDYEPADAESLISEISLYAATLSDGDEESSLASDEADDEAADHTDSFASAASAGFTASADTEASNIVAETMPAAQAGAADEDEGTGETPTRANRTVLKVSFKPDVPMVNARAVVILKQLGGQAHIQSHTPADLTSIEAAQAIAENGLLVIVDSADAEKAKRFLAKNSFIRRITVVDEEAPATAEPSVAEKKSEQAAADEDKFISLRWSSVRELQNMAGEFLIQAAQLKALCAAYPDETELRSAVSSTSRLVDDLVYHIDRMAMVSMSAMVPQLSRVVRDMCRASGKQVSFEVHGGNIEIDRNLYNSISDPLLHIIRNAVDHGIEPPEERLAIGKEARGKVTLSVENLGARVAFRVSDDGRGINTDKVIAKAKKKGALQKPESEYTRQEILRMVLMAGVSTADAVTQYSGRGVGMDVVEATVRDFNGHVDIQSEPGNGTSITLHMPVAVTSVESLGFRIGPTTYHMPLFNLSKLFTAEEAAEHISHYEGTSLFTFEKRQIPLIDMHKLLGCDGTDEFFIVCHSLSDEFVIGIDSVIGDVSCANKPLPSCLGPDWQAVCPIRNVAIMDDGTIGYALNAALLSAVAQGREDSFWQAGSYEELTEDDAYEIGLTGQIPSAAFVFTLGDSCYAMPISYVNRIVPLTSYAQTPKGMPYLLGLTNYRSQAIPLFDLAASAGADAESLYALVVENEQGEYEGFTITSAISVYDLSDAVLAETQPEPRVFAAGWHVAASIVDNPKEPPITLLARS